MAGKICSGCAAPMVREGNYFKCTYCPNVTPADVIDDINAVARANAWESLRKSDFERATELFEEIILKDKKDYESFWGLALAKASVVYVIDAEKDRKVPTLNNVSEDSFLQDKNVKTAIGLAPKEIAESYKMQAEYIDKVRLEWLEMASKEPPYDVFISFKDSDRENGIERTSDSVSAQDLYQMLTDEGYRVFYSRVSLRGKVAEQYEPYIYNAIKTAKVMLVYGEKAEYFNAPWIKNEWVRFKKRVEKGEKHKNALVTVFKGVDPYAIPTALTGGKQGIDYSNPVNVPILLNHIKMVVNAAKRTKQLDKVEIQGGQMGKKKSEIATEHLQTKELGSGFVIETSISEKQQLGLVKTYIQEKYWDGAERVVSELIENNPNLGEALWYNYLIHYNACSVDDLVNDAKYFQKRDFDLIAYVLACAEENFAKELLPQLYELAYNVTERACLELLKIILPYNFADRKDCIDTLFDKAIEEDWASLFNALIPTLDPAEVDKYIKLHLTMAKSSKVYTISCAQKVLEVDEGNLEALDFLYKRELLHEHLDAATSYFESYLKYSKDVKKELLATFEYLSKNVNNDATSQFALQSLKYCNGDFSHYKAPVVNMAFSMINKGWFNQAKEVLEVINSQDQSDANVFWGLCLIKAGAKTEQELVTANVSIFEAPEFDKYLTLVDSARRHECINLKHQRDAYLEQKRLDEYKQEQERKQRERQQAQQREKDRLEWQWREKERNKKKAIFGVKIGFFVLAILFALAGGMLLLYIDDIIDLGELGFFIDTLLNDGGYEIALGGMLLGSAGIFGALSAIVFEWWEFDMKPPARVIVGFVIGLITNIIMIVIGIVAFVRLLIAGWDD